jgi:type II secretory pathway component PulK
MKLSRAHTQSGIALIIVMICIAALSILAGGFAYSMKVETKLAMNAKAEGEFYGLAQSAVDYCKSVLAITCPEEPFDALNQHWAGGTGSLCSNELFSVVEQEVDLGYGRFSWVMVDRERWANINSANEAMLAQAMRLVGVDGADADALTAEILDWIDRDDNPHLNGIESNYYESLDPPYRSKNAFMDDISELLLLRSMTPDIYGLTENRPPPPPPSLRERLGIGFEEEYRPVATLKNLFTPISGGPININTASAEVLQLVPFIDENTAQRIVEFREQQPFRNVGEGLLAAGLNGQIIQQVQNMFAVRSATFEAHITAEIKGVKRYYTALIRRNNPRDIQVLAFYWKLKPFESNADAR